MNSFPPPDPKDRLARRLTPEEAAHFGVGGGPMDFDIVENGLVATHVLRTHDASGMQGTQLGGPPSNWPTERQRIKAKLRGGKGAYKGNRADMPHDFVPKNDPRKQSRYGDQS